MFYESQKGLWKSRESSKSSAQNWVVYQLQGWESMFITISSELPLISILVYLQSVCACVCVLANLTVCVCVSVCARVCPSESSCV